MYNLFFGFAVIFFSCGLAFGFVSWFNAGINYSISRFNAWCSCGMSSMAIVSLVLALLEV